MVASFMVATDEDGQVRGGSLPAVILVEVSYLLVVLRD